METIAEQRSRAATLDLRDIHPNMRLGTASDRYAGWIGAVYPDHLRDQVTVSKRRMKGQAFEEAKVPVESIRYFFEHFDCLEIDFTFYTVLRDDSGEKTPTFNRLEVYRDLSPAHAKFFLKAPQMFFARKLRSSRGGKAVYQDNPRFLDAAAYEQQFLRPAVEALGDKLAGITFQQEYQRVTDSPSSGANVEELDRFFTAVQGEVQSHIELRSTHLLTPEYFGWLRARGIGFVFSHWTWLPRLKQQWEMSGGQFSAADKNVIVRLLTPLNVRMPTRMRRRIHLISRRRISSTWRRRSR